MRAGSLDRLVAQADSLLSKVLGAVRGLRGPTPGTAVNAAAHQDRDRCATEVGHGAKHYLVTVSVQNLYHASFAALRWVAPRSQCGVKELARQMEDPRACYLGDLKRVGRSLVNFPRPAQGCASPLGMSKEVVCCSDGGHAARVRTRRSTSQCEALLRRAPPP